jgi:ADP-ribose pyrophosphatase YjhB (NUDIX family)
MLNIKPPDYIYCPICGVKLQKMQKEGRERKHCPNCGFKYYPHVPQSAVAVAVKNNKTLLVKRNRKPYKNTWMFPAGFTEYGEHPEETALRELKEETGLMANNPKLMTFFNQLTIREHQVALYFFTRWRLKEN